jgi:hypothetical protein
VLIVYFMVLPRGGCFWKPPEGLARARPCSVTMYSWESPALSTPTVPSPPTLHPDIESRPAVIGSHVLLPCTWDDHLLDPQFGVGFAWFSKLSRPTTAAIPQINATKQWPRSSKLGAYCNPKAQFDKPLQFVKLTCKISISPYTYMGHIDFCKLDKTKYFWRLTFRSLPIFPSFRLIDCMGFLHIACCYVTSLRSWLSPRFVE